MTKLKNSNATFQVIFKQCGTVRRDTVGTKFTKFSFQSLWMKPGDFQTPCFFFANNNLMHFLGLVCKKILVEENAQKWLKS